MKKLIIPFLLFSVSAIAKPQPVAKLRYSFEFILEKVLEKKRQQFKPEIPMPSLHMESKTPLKVFQDAIEEQWGMRPDQITNAYSIKHNMIFLNDDADYYERTGRCMDDSLAHELTHYVQDRYLHWDFNDESLEWDAIEVQTQFREEFCK
jgi:Zn-dependent peptidase ImmA (M78 family)